MNPSPDDGHLSYFSGHGTNVLIENPDLPDDSYLITRDQLKLYVAHSHALRNKAPRARPPTPLGYDFFAHAFNSEGLPATASYLDEQGTVISTGSSVEIGDIMGEEDEGETNLTMSAARMEQVEKMVWHTTLNASHQRERIEARRASQRKEKNFGRKQDQKLRKKGLGKVRKEADQPTTYPVAGASTSGLADAEMTLTE
ncbi:hypothetical protein P692DRAFT_20740403 [Suillus brevipes Sb2]|nr:hypothetical protein P692DRAFT_20740403 [Suillus brevipes Sb2]